MVWSRNDHWMVTADQTGYVKYWQSNMNNVKMFQAHKEPIRAIRCALTTGFGDVLLTRICIIDSMVFAINKFDHNMSALRNKVWILQQIKSDHKSVTLVHFNLSAIQTLIIKLSFACVSINIMI